MKTKKLFFAVMAMAACIMISACGGSKKMSSKSATGFVEVEKDKCQQKAEEQPAKRGYGVGEHFQEMTAKNIAEAQARAQLARAIGAAITSATDVEATSSVAYDGDMSGANIVSQQNAGSRDWVRSIAEEEVKYTTAISTCPAFNPTTQMYKVSVCVEYNESIAAMATNIAKKVQKLSDERKLEMNFEFEQYRKRTEAELEKKRNNQ